MAFVLIDDPGAGQPDLVTSNRYQINRVGLTDDRESFADIGMLSAFDSVTDVSGPSLPFPGSATNARVLDTQHQDFHYRFWVLPAVLNLTNPLLGVNIPFTIWNTFPTDEILQSIQATGVGSSDLTFDLVPLTTTMEDFALDTFNVQIGENATSVDADIRFNFPSGTALLEILAAIANTFNLIPEIPVLETWEFNTDVLKSFDGSEQRIALITSPRRTMQFSVQIRDQATRRQQYDLLLATIDLITTIPEYAHATSITQNSPIGATQIFFDPTQTQVRAGGKLVIVSSITEMAQVFEITTVNADGATINGSLGTAITTLDYVYPANSMIIRGGSGIVMNSVTGELNVTAESFEQPVLPRPGATPAISTLNGYNIMSLQPSRPAEELVDSRKEILDYDTGIKSILLQGDPHPIFRGSRKWSIRRYERTQDEDFMRQFIASAVGAQKAWLLPTWLADLTLAATPLLGASSIDVREIGYANLQVSDTWARIQIQYENLEPTYHQVTATSVVDQDTLRLTISPNLPADPEASNITTISFLLKVIGEDRIRRSHEAAATIYTWGFETTDYG